MISAGFTNKIHHPDATIDILESLLKIGASRNKYRLLFNQSIVLAVSYFSSTISAIFNDSLTFYLNNIETLPKELKKESFKFSLTELNELQYNLSTEIGRMIARKSDISFQDMQSISKAFKKFCGVHIPKDADVDNIIAALALRHAIAHNSEKIDQPCMNMLSVAKNRSFYLETKLDIDIIISKEDFDVIAKSMIKYVDNLISSIESKIGDSS